MTTPTQHDPDPTGMADFDWQLNMIWEVLGGTIPQKDLSNVAVAKMLELRSAAGITQRRNGSAQLKPSEASAIIKGYKLHLNQLDASLFDLRDPVLFRAELRKHGAGVYAQAGARRLVQMLNRALVTEGLGITLQRGAGRRGIGYGPPQTPPMMKLHPGEQIGLSITAQAGRHVAVIQLVHGSPDLIETLAPSAIHPDTLVEAGTDGKGRLVLPRDRTDSLIVQGDPGLFRLMLIEAEEELVNLFACGEVDALGQRGLAGMSDDDDPGLTPPRLGDQDIGRIIAWLEENPKASLRTAEAEFLVVVG
ncbi:hypothetical protein [Roseovarius sp. MBR-6]|jgi:hypothetical protein|uniref:hypothetical protein n=1 Tax=Roseovarius sp. MBR-6 TaxID=3156459 RepID=UPI003399DBAD